MRAGRSSMATATTIPVALGSRSYDVLIGPGLLRHAAELIDRFGSLPEEVEHLLKIVFIKGLCRKANVEKLDAGPKGVVLHFRKRELPDPAGLVRYIA